jgi:hypothetical protein
MGRLFILQKKGGKKNVRQLGCATFGKYTEHMERKDGRSMEPPDYVAGII